MDGLVAGDGSERSGRVLLLPGSRLPEARQNLERMLALLEELPAGLRKHDFQAALVRELPAAAVEALAASRGWSLSSSTSRSLWLKRQGGAAVLLGAIHHPAASGSGGGLDGGHRQRAGRRFGQDQCCNSPAMGRNSPWALLKPNGAWAQRCIAPKAMWMPRTP